MELIGRGRAAEIWAIDEHVVLRRDTRGHDTAPAARMLRHLAEVGYPVPRVIGVDGPELRMERIHGPDLLGALRGGEVSVDDGFRMLGRLAARLTDVPVPRWLAAADDATPDVATIAHLDFHPANVLLGPDGPVVIDWDNARRGDRELDLALTGVILRTDPIAIELLGADTDRALAVLAAESGVDPSPALERAVRRRLRDRNLTDAEREAVAALLPRGAGA